MNRFVILSGCSGGGKSTLIEALRRRGHRVVEEPGRRIIAAERARGGRALPWVDLAAFLDRAIAMALADRAAAAAGTGLVFFDRGLVDALVARAHCAGETAFAAEGAGAARGGSGEWAALARAHPSNRAVFFVPPWPGIFRTDGDRRHGLAEAVAEYDRLAAAYPALGHTLHVLPKVPVETRADHVLAILGAG
ncbi:AAA family ATPase [Prosthecomicrobium pneumaticum]|uniref:Putative ATPase n=1 Tax=Prosthecomicrobium pneumaticum TaxID=81895 RepID=A0A7W9CU92_9HYPH|nr:AAA family ATPase [Prosthecomicrobium pneumaticum]MBB5751668.1 putative ATPase [Prosthecomicrobium pneumaticum]